METEGADKWSDEAKTTQWAGENPKGERCKFVSSRDSYIRAKCQSLKWQGHLTETLKSQACRHII